MKIVVFGPGRRTGALRDDMVVDLSGAFGKYAYEKLGEAHPVAKQAIQRAQQAAAPVVAAPKKAAPPKLTQAAPVAATPAPAAPKPAAPSDDDWETF